MNDSFVFVNFSWPTAINGMNDGKGGNLAF